MSYKIKTWIPVTIAPEDDIIYDTKEEAEIEMEQMDMMQPENINRVVECDESGEEIAG